MKDIYLYGASGHGKVVAEIAVETDYAIRAFIDDDRAKKDCLGYPILHQIPTSYENIFISVGNNRTRKNISNRLINVEYPVLIHKHSNVSPRTSLGHGTVVMAGATVNCDSKIGKHTIINTNSSVDHDCVVGDFVHISPNVALAGQVSVGEGTHIGIGACVIPQVKIGKWCVIGAGAVVINDVEDGSVIVGNPGRLLRKNEI